MNSTIFIDNYIKANKKTVKKRKRRKAPKLKTDYNVKNYNGLLRTPNSLHII